MDDRLINTVLSGEASQEEIARLNAWIDSDPVNKEQYEDIKFVLGARVNVDTSQSDNGALQEVKANIKSSKRRDKLKTILKILSFVIAFLMLLVYVAFAG